MKIVYLTILLSYAFAYSYLLLIMHVYSSELSLNGEWTVKNVNGSIKIAAQVPGQVHLDLLKAKIINDPYFNDHVLEYKSCFIIIRQTWVAFEDWEYSREFDISADVKNCINH